MDIITFDSHDDMAAYLRERAQHALDGLHPAQATLTYGEHWCRFVDLDNFVIEFGHISTPKEITAGEIESGALLDDVQYVLDSTDANLLAGYMYGRAHSRLNITGDLGTTHKAHVWPIEKRLFDAAVEVEFDYRKFDETARFMLNLAFRLQKAHALPVIRP